MKDTVFELLLTDLKKGNIDKILKTKIDKCWNKSQLLQLFSALSGLASDQREIINFQHERLIKCAEQIRTLEKELTDIHCRIDAEERGDGEEFIDPIETMLKATGRWDKFQADLSRSEKGRVLVSKKALSGLVEELQEFENQRDYENAQAEKGGKF